MCGISGHSNFTQTSPSEIMASMQHRGPDGQFYWTNDAYTLFHSRLSIIDIGERSNQPFIDHTGRYILVFNGEIYNYLAIKSALNYPFQTSSDTEVLMALLIEKGTAALDLLDGMFAFAFYDRHEDKLILARDPLGKKPLYYCTNDNHFSFASEIRTLLKFNHSQGEISKRNLSTWLHWQTIPGDKTLINDIVQVSPGSFLERSKNGEIEHGTFWQIDAFSSAKKRDLLITSEEAVKQIREKTILAIEKRLVADVPFASFLSGGIDSSITSIVAAQKLGSALNTFTIGFEEKQFSEHTIAQKVAKKYNTNHHEIIVQPNDFLDIIEEGIAYTDHPSGDGLNTYLISKKTVKEGFKMAISGIGGDEWFSGYHYFNDFDKWRKLRSLGNLSFLNSLVPFKYRKALEIADQVNRFKGNAYPKQRILFDSYTLQHTFGLPLPHPLLEDQVGEFSQSNYSRLEWKYYSQPVLLRDSDQYSMAVGLELRAPFMDKELVEFALSLPDSIRKGERPKNLLIEAFIEELPQEVYDRKKMGFTLPWEIWMKEELKDFCTARIIDFSTRIENENILKYWHAFLKGSNEIGWNRFWSIVSLEDWLERNQLKVIE